MIYDNMDIYRESLQRLKSFRETNGMTQKEVADILRVDRSTYAYYEAGKSIPSIDTVDKLLKIFRIDYADLFGEGPAGSREERAEVFRDNRDMMYMVDLTSREKMLISCFRIMKKTQQDALMRQLGILPESDREKKAADSDASSVTLPGEKKKD